jgi:tetratricopeptide (TPR) repeat protein
VDQSTGFQDASETTNTDLTNDPKINAKLNQLKLNFQGCEFRAVLAGYVSSAAMLRLEGSVWQYELPPIFLKPLENAPGTTISMTSLNAPNDAKHNYEKARKAYDQEKFMDAEKELDKAVKNYPGFAAAWSLLGDIHQRLKQPDQAVMEYNQALRADPQYVNPAFGLALIAVQQKRWQDAVQFSDQVSKLNSAAFPSAYFYNAVANFNLGKSDLAEISARKFKTLDTQHRHPDICLLLSQILTHKQDYQGAAQELRDYLAIAPGAANADAVREQLRKLEQASVAKKQ